MNKQPTRGQMFYQAYGKDLYRLTGSEMTDSIIDMLGSNPGANNASNVTVSASDFGSGVDTSTAVVTTGSTQAGKKTYDNTISGYILGVDPKDGYAKLYIGNTTNFLNWSGTALTVSGSIQTAMSGTRLVINSGTNDLSFFVGSEVTPRAYIGTGGANGSLFQIVNPAGSTLEGINISNTNTNSKAAIDISNSAAANSIVISHSDNTNAALQITAAASPGQAINISQGNLRLINGDFDSGSTSGLTRWINVPRIAGPPGLSDIGPFGYMYDVTNNKLYFNNNGTLKSVAFT